MTEPDGGPSYDPKNLQVIFFALLAAQLFFFVYALITLETAVFRYKIDDFLFTLVPVLALAADILGNRIFTRQFSELNTLEDMQKTLQKLARIHLIRWMLVEGATLLLIVFTMITNNHFFSAFAAINIVYFITLRPKLFTFNEGF